MRSSKFAVSGIALVFAAFLLASCSGDGRKGETDRSDRSRLLQACNDSGEQPCRRARACAAHCRLRRRPWFGRQGCKPARQAEHAAGRPQQGRWRWRWRQEESALSEEHEHEEHRT